MQKRKKQAAVAKSEGEVSPGFADLVCSVVRVPNPQFSTGNRPGEADLAESICSWLSERAIQHECNLSWGIHAVLTGPEGAGAPGVLLAAHMDSDHLHIPDLAGVKVEGSKLLCPGQVGLDCKTGIAIALSVLDRLRDAPGAWQVHLLCTVGEESGQKGAIRAPLARLLAGRVRYGFVIDRQTSGRNCPRDEDGKALRHAVCKYKGVPLLEPTSGPHLLQHLHAGFVAADPRAVAAGPLPLIESPNCADAVELRGRWDAEVVAPASQPPSAALKQALKDYHATTSKVVEAMARCAPEARVGGMNQQPRIGRYGAMRKIYDAIYGAESRALVKTHEIAATGPGASNLPPEPQLAALAFSCVNLSYDYDDDWDECDLSELDRTANVLLHTCLSCFASSHAVAQE